MGCNPLFVSVSPHYRQLWHEDGGCRTKQVLNKRIVSTVVPSYNPQNSPCQGFFLFCFCLFLRLRLSPDWLGTHCISQTGLQLTIFLPQPLKSSENTILPSTTLWWCLATELDAIDPPLTISVSSGFLCSGASLQCSEVCCHFSPG
jgi:hypothetical protein